MTTQQPSPYWFEGAHDESGSLGNRALQGAAGALGGAIIGDTVARFAGLSPGNSRLVGGTIGAVGSAILGPRLSRWGNQRNQKFVEDTVRRQKSDYMRGYMRSLGLPDPAHTPYERDRQEFEAALDHLMAQERNLNSSYGPMYKIRHKIAAYVAATRPDLFQKAAAEFMASQFPSLSAAFDAYSQSREYQKALQAQQNAAAFPALHATQPAMYYANQQFMSGGTPDMAAAQPHHHRRHRHHG